MNIFKKVQLYFIGNALGKITNPFDRAKVKVLFNFCTFLFISNLPYTFLSFSSHPAHFISAIVQNVFTIAVILILKNKQNLRLAVNMFMTNFIAQNIFHYLINNGKLLDQAVLFYTLIILFAFILIGRKWGFAITLFVCISICIGIYNVNNNYA
ncbi:MAG TPA: hypothetical protein VD905_05450, partial [Flavobacteriales bacterium]|nr:hypothetical protein [Flavobacteriales bacterium]